MHACMEFLLTPTRIPKQHTNSSLELHTHPMNDDNTDTKNYTRIYILLEITAAPWISKRQTRHCAALARPLGHV